MKTAVATCTTFEENFTLRDLTRTNLEINLDTINALSDTYVFRLNVETALIFENNAETR